jgi:hypothetical protein
MHSYSATVRTWYCVIIIVVKWKKTWSGRSGKKHVCCYEHNVVYAGILLCRRNKKKRKVIKKINLPCRPHIYMGTNTGWCIKIELKLKFLCRINTNCATAVLYNAITNKATYRGGLVPYVRGCGVLTLNLPTTTIVAQPFLMFCWPCIIVT